MVLPVNWVFKIPAISEIFVAEWGAGDLLNFYASLLSSIITIIALVVTINFTNKQNRLERIFERNMIINENKKNIIEADYNAIFINIDKIKSVVLLETLNVTSIIDFVSGFGLDKWGEALSECFEIIDSFDKLNNEIEKLFVKTSGTILFDIFQYIQAAQKEWDIAKNSMEKYNMEKHSFDLEQEKLKNSPEYIQKKLSFMASQINPEKQEFKSIKPDEEEFKLI